MSKSVRSDTELLNAAAAFFEEAFKNVAASSDDSKKILGSGSFQIQEGVIFALNHDVQKALLRLVQRCTTLLGSSAGNEKDIRSIAWKEARKHADVLTESYSDRAKLFITEVIDQAAIDYIRILPCFSFRLEQGVDAISAGPVTILRGTAIETQYNSANPDSKIKLHTTDSTEQFTHSDDIMLASIAPTVWRVDLKAAPGNLHEEAIWLVNIATSLFRLRYNGWNAFAPGNNDQEALSVARSDGKEVGVTIKDAGISLGGWRLPHFYVVDSGAAAAFAKPDFQALAEQILQPARKSLAERIHQGLGWITRARQTTDRSERFLFLFTAIEALLTGSDQSAPVTQTVARNAATILATDISGRSSIAEQIIKLYQTRSSLVHTGKRSVLHAQVSLAQQIAEALYWRVMDVSDASQDFDTFQSSLKRAGFGSEWPAP